MSDLHTDQLRLRIEFLERACRRWKSVVFCALVASAVTLLITASGVSQQPPTVPPRQASAAGSAQIPTDMAGILINYVNYARIDDNAEELFLNLGINTQTRSNPNDGIKVSDKVVMSFYTAKRLQQGLQIAVERHEKQFGLIETDPAKRSRLGAGQDPVRQP